MHVMMEVVATSSPKTTRSLIVWLVPLFAVVALALLYDRAGTSSTRIGPFVLFSTRSNLRNSTIGTSIADAGPDSCDCFSEDYSTPTASSNNHVTLCCERVLWRTHKFGTVLLGDLFADFRPRAGRQHPSSATTAATTSNSNINKSKFPTIETRPTPKSSNYSLPDIKNGPDYRHVLVTRNWFDAIVSGYLYHKAGFECTVEFGGSTAHHSKHFDMELHYHNKFWDTQHLTYHARYKIPYPPRQNRSLCEYLAQESEEDGIPIIMDVALSRWYKGVVAYHEKALAAAAADGVERSLFLCFEDLVDPFQQEQMFYQILNFLFPSRSSNNTADGFFQMPAPMKQALLRRQQQNQSQYEGGHASAHDPALRARLRALVERYDRELFRGVVASSNAIFGCGTGLT